MCQYLMKNGNSVTPIQFHIKTCIVILRLYLCSMVTGAPFSVSNFDIFVIIFVLGIETVFILFYEQKYFLLSTIKDI